MLWVKLISVRYPTKSTVGMTLGHRGWHCRQTQGIEEATTGCVRCVKDCDINKFPDTSQES